MSFIADLEHDLMSYCLKHQGKRWANHFFYNKEVKVLYGELRCLEVGTIVALLGSNEPDYKKYLEMTEWVVMENKHEDVELQTKAKGGLPVFILDNTNKYLLEYIAKEHNKQIPLVEALKAAKSILESRSFGCVIMVAESEEYRECSRRHKEAIEAVNNALETIKQNQEIFEKM